jgi:hypothetical protein
MEELTEALTRIDEILAAIEHKLDHIIFRLAEEDPRIRRARWQGCGDGERGENETMATEFDSEEE